MRTERRNQGVKEGEREGENGRVQEIRKEGTEGWREKEKKRGGRGEQRGSNIKIIKNITTGGHSSV